MKRFVWAFSIFLSSFLLLSAGRYFADDFSTGDNWALGNNPTAAFPEERANYYGRQGICSVIDEISNVADPPGTGTYMPVTTVNYVQNNTLKLEGLIPHCTIEQQGKWSGDWKGFAARFTNRTFRATKREPFGVEVIKTYANLDPQASWKNGASPRMNNEFFIMLYEPAGYLADDPLESYPDKVLYFEQSRKTINQDRSYWGYYIYGENVFNFNTDPRSPYGETHDLEAGTGDNLADNVFEWKYAVNQSIGAAGEANTNAIGMRITHDGEYVRFYLNPDPNDTHGALSNEYYHISTVQVAWSNAFTVMVGRDTARYDSEAMDIHLSNMTVRPPCSNVVAEMSPAEFQAGTTGNALSLLLEPSFYDADDAGVAEVIIVPPDELSNVVWSNALTSFKASSNGTYVDFAVTNAGGPANGRVEIFERTKDNRKEVVIRMCRESDVVNNVISNATATKKIYVGFTVDIPSGSFGKNVAFEAYLGNEHYDGDAYSYHATTEPALAVAGDAGTEVATSSLLFSVYNEATALAMFSPDTIQVSEPKTEFTVVVSLSEATNANPDVVAAMVLFDEAFSPYVSEVKSVLISSGVYITETNFAANGETYDGVVLDYSGAGVSISAPGGFDIITLPLGSTPASGTNTNFSVYVRSALSPVWQKAGTNALYDNQTLFVQPLPPNFLGSIEHPLYFNDPAIDSNEMRYRIVNMGGSGNEIIAAMLFFPDFITNIYSNTITTGTYATSNFFDATSNILYFYFTNDALAPGSNETFTLWFQDNVSTADFVVTTNFDIVSACDNGNGDGFVSNALFDDGWEMTITYPQPLGKSFFATNMFETIDFVITTTLVITNYGVPANVINKAKVLLPAGLGDAFAVSSLVATSASSFSNGTEGADRYLYIDYTVDATSIAGEAYDEITFSMTNVTTNAQATKTFDVFAANTGTYYAVEEYETNMAATNERMGNTLYIEVPKPDVRVSVFSNDTYDAASVTNEVTLIISNRGREGNNITNVKIFIPTAYVTEIAGLSATHGASVPVGYHDGYIDVRYVATSLQSSETDAISFSFVDAIGSSVDIFLSNEAVSVFGNAHLETADIAHLTYTFPEPEGEYYVCPRYVDTNAGRKTVNIVFTNTGVLFNAIERVKIALPDYLTDKNVEYDTSGYTVISNHISLENGTNFLNVFYDAASTVPGGESETLTIAFSNDAFVATNLALDRVYLFNDRNNENNGELATEVAGLSNALILAPAWESSITPVATNLLAGNKTYTYTFMHPANAGTGMRFRFVVPFPITEVTEINGNAIDVEENGTNYIVYDEGAIYYTFQIEFTASNVMTNDLIASFPGAIDYGDGGGYIPIENVPVIDYDFPSPNVVAEITPEAVTTNTRAFTFRVSLSNSGLSGNNVRFIKVLSPTNGTYPAHTDVVDYFTNVSLSHGFDAWSNAGGALFIALSNALQSDETDDLLFTAFFNDDLVVTPNLTWNVLLGNKLTIAEEMFPATGSASARRMDVIAPNYDARVAFTANETVIENGTNVNVLRTEFVTNTIRVLVSNASGEYAGYEGLTNILERVRIAYPAYVTHMAVSNASMVTAVTNGAGSVSFAFNTPLFRNEYTIFDLYVVDTNEFTSVPYTNFDVDIFFNTSGSESVNDRENYVRFDYEDVTAHMNVLTTIVYIGLTNVLEFEIYNDSAYDGNRITKAKVVFPLTLTNYIFPGMEAYLATDLLTNGGITVSNTNEIHLDYAGMGNAFAGGSVDTVRITITNLTTYFTNAAWSCVAYNGEPAASGWDDTNTSGAKGVLPDDESSFAMTSMEIPTNKSVFYDVTSGPLYSIYATNAVTIEVVNEMEEDVAAIKLFFPTNESLFTNIAISSRYQSALSNSNFVVNNEGLFVLDYEANTNTGALAKLQSDVITLTFAQITEANTNIMIHGFYKIANTSAWLPFRVKGNATSNVSVQYADWAILEGTYTPSGESVTANVYAAGGSAIAQDAFTNDLTTLSEGANTYRILYVPAGTYDIELDTKNYYTHRYITNFTVTPNTIMTLPEAALLNLPYLYDTPGTQYAVWREDTNVSLTIPQGALRESVFIEFSHDVPLAQSNALTNDDALFFATGLKDANRTPITTGLPLTTNTYATLTLAGASNAEYAIMYYEPMMGRWRALGGKADATTGRVTANINYLYEYYAIVPKDSITVPAEKEIYNVTVTPEVFTPSAAGDAFSSVRISFQLKAPITDNMLRVYDMKGNLVREIPIVTEYNSVDVLWDGKDVDGFVVRSGLYVYQVRLNTSVHSGMIMVVK